MLSIDAPVLSIEAPVLSVVVSSEELGGALREEASAEQVKLTLDSTVLFGKDSAVLLPEAAAVLDRSAQELVEAGPGQVAITGYTDDLGSEEHGLVLSRQRAQAVTDVLRPRLPEADYPLTADGKGEADPAVPNDSEENRQRNRRVEIVYTPH